VTVSQEGGQQDAGGQGAWLDMSRYPDTDPDTVLSSDDHSLLTTSLAVDDAELPDSVWEHMLAVVVGSDAAEPTDDPAADDDPDTEVAAYDDDATWTADLEHTLGLDDHAVADPAGDPHGTGDDPAGVDDGHPGAEGDTL
jgi:hypothetical protein